jgi:aminoglycoside phosphotransferase (APT) family kinase protein
MNQEILASLQARLAEDPSANLDDEMPRVQFEAKRKHFPHPTALLLQQRQKPPQLKPQGFPASLLKSSAKPVVLRPLSDIAKALIFGNNDEVGEEKKAQVEGDLDGGVRRMIEQGVVIAKLPGCRGVLRCGDVAIKVAGVETLGSEYSALEYLAEHAPDFPAPRPHGLIGLGNARPILMSYIPSATLQSVWPNLGHDNKLSIRRQLGQLFTMLRKIKLQSGGRLGGVGGEGVSDNHAWVGHADRDTVITTAVMFRDFQFSIEAPCGTEYAAFLKSLLPGPDPNERAVFTHGDVFPGNIMVDVDPARPVEYVVTGVIDWEESGFYPAWFEASKVLYTFRENGMADMQDWWRYVPDCIAPARYPTEWAVGRLWDKANGVDA